MRLYRIMLMCAIFSATTYCTKDSFFRRKKATLVSTLETKHCFISYVKINGKLKIVKQKKLENKQIAAVRDALAAFLVEKLKIAHQVEIIYYKESFPGKIQEGWPATIHTIAPGDTVRKQPNTIYSKLRLRQLWALAKNFDETGITREMIRQITWHPQLPVIMAIDLITGNSDRHCGNLCYDSATDTFCAIDMDDTFNKDLCRIAGKKFVQMMADPYNVFTVEEIKALIIVRKTLQYILDRYSASQVIKKLYYFARRAGFIPGNRIYTPSIVKKLALYESTIEQTWLSARSLVKLISQVISKQMRDGFYEQTDIIVES